jgi:hypothetical protein
LGSSQGPCPQPRAGSFRFPSVLTPQERSKRPSICGWWRRERSSEWLAS